MTFSAGAILSQRRDARVSVMARDEIIPRIHRSWSEKPKPRLLAGKAGRTGGDASMPFQVSEPLVNFEHPAE